jgi:hypothetical protein
MGDTTPVCGDGEETDGAVNTEACVRCQRVMGADETWTCEGCGNAVCPSCSSEDDFGIVRCDPRCGL